MFYLSLYTFFSFIVGIYFGIYILRLNARVPVNRIFFLIIISFCFWMLGYTFIFSSTDRETAFFWYRFSSIGWTIMPGLMLNFSMAFTEKKTLIRKKWLYPILYIPGSVFLYQSMTGILFAEDFLFHNGIVIEVPASDSNWFWLYLIYNVLFVLIGFALLIHYFRKTKSIRIRKQLKIIIISFIVPFVSVYIFNILNMLNNMELPVVGHLSFLFPVAGIWYAIDRYKLMKLSTSIATEKVLANMMDLMFLLNRDGDIILTNCQVKKTLGYEQHELEGIHFNNISSSEIPVFSSSKGSDVIKDVESAFITKENAEIPVSLSASAIYDDFNEKVGTVIVGHDIRDKEELKRKNNVMEEELMLAQKVQYSIIPSSPPAIPGLEFSVIYNPMAFLGGDFYDFIKLREMNLLGIFVGDVSGHGVPAALITSMVKTLLETAGDARGKPVKLLEFINTKMKYIIGDNFLTAVYCIFDQDTRTLRYVRGGHTYPCLIRNGEVQMLRSKGPLLGLYDETDFEEKTIQLQKGDKVLFYTDGLSEAPNGKGEFFEDTIYDFMSEISGKGVNDFVHSIYEQADLYCCNNFDDDVLLIGMEIK